MDIRADRHADRVDIGIGDHVVVIRIDRLGAELARGILRGCLVAVTDSGDFKAAACQLRHQHPGCMAAAANPADLDRHQ